MSIDKHFEKRGVNLTDDNSLPLGERTQRSVKRVIAAVRAAESEWNDEQRECNARCQSALDKVIELQDRNRELEAKLLKFQIEEKLGEMPSMTEADKQHLLEVSA